MTVDAPYHLVALYGTAREALALASVIRAVRTRPNLLRITTVAVGPPDLWAEPALVRLGVTTDYSLPLSSSGAAPPQQRLGETVAAIAPFLAEQEPRLTLVAGDGWVAAAAGLLGGYGRAAIVHVGAGRRYYRPGKGWAAAVVTIPRAWEFHRRLLAAGAHLHLTATDLGRGNLLRAGLDPAKVFVTGSPLVDAAQRFARGGAVGGGAVGAPGVVGPPDVAGAPGVAAAAGPAGAARPGGFARTPAAASSAAAAGPPGATGSSAAPRSATAAVHRRVVLAVADGDAPDNDALVEFYRALRAVADGAANTLMVVEAPARRVLRPLALRHLVGSRRIKLVAPMTYRRRWYLLSRSYCAITMGGVLEEEGPCFDTPVLIMADGTSWPEMVELGGNRLTGADGHGLARHLRTLLRDPGLRAAMAAVPNPYGDGDAGGRIVQVIAHHLEQARFASS